ncbi:ATP-binding protein [Kribbella ginsengisoli]|uniref:XRE family transcriptional regulator n=1 Tax=Kribbella ginsengisoli TaxID=363865 RepID=A0ABP6VQA3_9ACTN
MNQSFGQQLRRLRLAAGLTQAGLGERAGLTDQAIRLLEHGERRYPRSGTVRRLMDALQLDEPSRAALLRSVPRRGRGNRPQPTRDGLAGPPWTVSQQLPPIPAHFTGRQAEFEQASEVFTAPLISPGSPPVVTIQGMAGVGKSALAFAVAAHVAERFPDGQLYLDLGGFGPSPPLREDEALYSLLRATGLADSELPTQVAEAGALLRSRLSGRRVLIVLDNATGADQVTPLLPAASTCAVLVTSRVWLTLLPAQTHLQLDALDDSAALELFRRIVGADRIDAEPGAAAELVENCAGLPLVIQIAAGRLVAQPLWHVERLVERLRDQRHRIDELAVDDVTVRASLAVSFPRPGEESASAGEPSEPAFAALGLINVTDLTAAAAACLIGTEQATARGQLERMVDANLLTSSGPSRYRLHDLLHLYARELAQQLMPTADQDEALDRLLGLYETIGWRTTRLIAPMSYIRRIEPPDQPEVEPAITEVPDLLQWLGVEHETIVKLAKQLTEAGVDRSNRLAGLTIGLTPYFISCGRFIDLAALARQALEATSSQDLKAILRCSLGIAQAELGQPDEALDSFRTAGSEFRENDDRHGEAAALNNATRLLGDLGRSAEAIATGERALEVSRSSGNAHSINLALNNLGNVHCLSGAFETGRDYFVQSLSLYTETGEETGRGIALHNLGCVTMDLGRPDEAVPYLEQSVGVLRAVGMQLTLCNALIDLADAYCRLHVHEDAVDRVQEALAIATSADDRLRLARASLQLGKIYSELDDPASARDHLEDALAYFASRDEAAANRVKQVLDSLPAE